jgi:hypothetical protein
MSRFLFSAPYVIHHMKAVPTSKGHAKQHHFVSIIGISCVTSAMDTLGSMQVEQLGWGKGQGNPVKGMHRPLGEGPMGQPMAHPQNGDRPPMAKPSAAQQQRSTTNKSHTETVV